MNTNPPALKQQQKNQTNFLDTLMTEKLVDQAKSRYQVAQKALTHINTPETRRYWQGYQDALQDILQKAGITYPFEVALSDLKNITV